MKKIHGVRRKSVLGFTLIETMVVLGILAGASAMVAALMQNMNRGQVQFMQSMALQDMITEITQYLRDPGACKQTMTAASIPGPGGSTNIAAIKNSTGTNAVQVNQEYGSGFGKIKPVSFKLKNTGPAPANQKILTTYLEVGYQKMKMPTGWHPTQYKSINITVQSSGGPVTVIGCATDANIMSEAMCTALGGAYDFSDSRCKELNLIGPTSLSGATSLNGPVNITGATTVNGNATVTGNIVANSSSIGTLTVAANATVSGLMAVTNANLNGTLILNGAGRLCGATGCMTRFPQGVCTGAKQVMLGISGGNVICGTKW
ncbi:MAG TPA: hypothetical protein DCS07_07700 [Bdellovibrionales bacterium]|nr:MAG: hypothetical protein A2Z97_03295 [Bdellovibrionales bacterium GWB1_52_6]OFZ02898.1 MAG: hypothetical protein A2X97_04820 [Bdellovibrionales bacterium GWA1_52_35]OFZ35835.1 MAG: hypothetical protein A2070_06165 [Bdellovibrionales bacterium GWC1_52_8]HAR42501.1 hypothetical protein [Bdellovibrionales bacterium]HCM38481.1 hypothetical protein [Bdellovibrionales bacterium]